MFERYTEKARRVIFAAHFEARAFESPYIEADHLLLGLMREDGAYLAQFANSQEVIQSIRKELESRLGERHEPEPGDLPLSLETKRLLAYGAEEADLMEHRYIAPGHLLLGLLREEKCAAAELLRNYGFGLDTVREGMMQEQDRSESDREEIARDTPPSATSARKWRIPRPRVRGRGKRADGRGPCHIARRTAIGLLRIEKCAAQDILREAGLELDKLREEISRRRSEQKKGAG